MYTNIYSNKRRQDEAKSENEQSIDIDKLFAKELEDAISKAESDLSAHGIPESEKPEILERIKEKIKSTLLQLCLEEINNGKSTQNTTKKSVVKV